MRNYPMKLRKKSLQSKKVKKLLVYVTNNLPDVVSWVKEDIAKLGYSVKLEKYVDRDHSVDYSLEISL